MMKKRSLWILTVSALICLSMLLAACEPAVPADGTGDGTKLVDEDVDYSALISQWTAYMTPVERAEDDGYYKNYSSANKAPDYEGYVSYGNFYYKTESIPTDIIGLDKTYIYIYDSMLDPILTFEETGYSEVLDDFKVSYTISGLLVRGNVIEISKVEWNEESSDWLYSYAYYDISGKLIAQLDESAYDFDTGFSLGEKSYHFNEDGKLFYTGHATESYIHLEKYENEYTNAEGKTYGYVELYNDLIVYDDNYTVVAEYTIGIGEEWYILDNGDVYIFCQEDLPDAALDYDAEDDWGKYNITHKLLSVTTGELKTLELDFCTAEVYSNYSTEKTGLKIKDGYTYFEIFRINEDREIAKDPEFVVFDNALNEAVTLPKIFKNQYALIGSADSESLIFGTERRYFDYYEDCKYANYKVNVNTFETERYIDVLGSAEIIGGGYIVDGKVIALDGAEVFDLEENEYEIKSDNVYYLVEGEYEDAYDKQDKQKFDIYVGGFVDREWVENLIATTVRQEISGEEDGGDTVFTVINEEVVYAENSVYLVKTTTATDNKTTSEFETVIDYTLYDRYGNFIAAFYDCKDASISYGDEMILAVASQTQDGYETTRYIIK